MTENIPAGSADGTPAISRRALVTAAAWSVPVIVLTTASPASAAVSGEPPVDPALIILGPHAIANQHGFVITNTSMQLVNVLVTFTANVTGPTESVEDVLRAVTDDDSADFYSEIATAEATATAPSDTYRHVWTGAITLEPVSALESKASRDGSMIFTLPAGAAFRFWQDRPWSLLSPSPTVRATVASMATGDGPMLPVTDGMSVAFTL